MKNKTRKSSKNEEAEDRCSTSFRAGPRLMVYRVPYITKAFAKPKIVHLKSVILQFEF